MKFVIKDANGSDYFYDLTLDSWLDDVGQEFNDNYIVWIGSELNARKFNSIYDAMKCIDDILMYVDCYSPDDFEIVEVV